MSPPQTVAGTAGSDGAGSEPSRRSHATPSADTSPHRAQHTHGSADPVHLVERVVTDVARVDAAAQPAHQPRPGGLPEDGGAGGVHADQPQPGPVPAQRTDDARTVPARADAAHQDVQMVQLHGEFGGERGVTGAVARVVVLVGPVRAGQLGQQFPEPGQPRGLPAAPRGGTVHDLEPDPVGPQQPPHGRFQFAVAHQDDRMAEGLPREGESQAQRAGRRLHHRGAGPQQTPLTGVQQHRHGGPCLHPAGRETFELRPEPGVRIRQPGRDPHDGRTSQQGQQLRPRHGPGDGSDGGGHRAPPRYTCSVLGPPSSQKKGYGSAHTALTPCPTKRGSTGLPVCANVTSRLPCSRA